MGGKAKKAKAKREAARASASMPVVAAVPVADAAGAEAEAEEGEEDQDEDAGSAVAAAMESKVTKTVRFAKELPTCAGIRRSRPTSQGWTWGGVMDKPTSHFDLRNMPWYGTVEDGVSIKKDRVVLKAHQWGLRVAAHVAAGGEAGVWSDTYTQKDEDWIVARTHRRWCPYHWCACGPQHLTGYGEPCMQVEGALDGI